MQLTIEATEMFTYVRGVKCRLWRAVGEDVELYAAIPILRVLEGEHCTAFEARLRKLPPPVRLVDMLEKF